MRLSEPALSVRSKLLLLLAAVATATALTGWVVQRQILLPGFAEAERSEAREDLARVLEALRSDAEALHGTAQDYSCWDDTYAYLDDGNRLYEEENFTTGLFSNSRLDVVVYLRVDGSLRWGGRADSATGERLDDPVLVESIRSAPPLRGVPPEGLSGILLTERGPVLIGAHQVLQTDRAGPPRGVVVLGRLLDDANVADLATRTHVQFRTWLNTSADLPVVPGTSLATRPPGDAVFDARDPDTLHGYATMADLSGEPNLVLDTALPRAISGRGRTALRAATLGSLAVGLALLGATWFGLSVAVLRPLGQLTRHALRVGKQGDLAPPLRLDRSDEIGTLAEEFDTMVRRLADSRREMLEVARRAGQADFAVEMLHNVGNVLTGVTVASAHVAEHATTPVTRRLEDLADLLDRNQDDLPMFMAENGDRVRSYVRALVEESVAERLELAEDTERLLVGVAHIRDLLTAREAAGPGARPLEVITVQALVADTGRLHAASFERYGIQMRTSNEAEGRYRVDRSAVLQILGNLLQNALTATKDRPDGRVVLHAATSDDGRRLRIQVVDNGIGIAADRITAIFSPGNSTRPGSLGIGLHSAANTATRLGGVLTASSPGEQQGATFTLDLPVERVAA